MKAIITIEKWVCGSVQGWTFLRSEEALARVTEKRIWVLAGNFAGKTFNRQTGAEITRFHSSRYRFTAKVEADEQAAIAKAKGK